MSKDGETHVHMDTEGHQATETRTEKIQPDADRQAEGKW